MTLSPFYESEGDFQSNLPLLVLLGRSNTGKSSLCRLLSPPSVRKKIRVGKKPGVTRRNVVIQLDEFTIVDMPGFGYMEGVSESTERKVQEEIIIFLEKNKEKIFLAIEVINLPVFRTVFTKYMETSVPFDKELFDFLQDLTIPTMVMANKVDKLSKRELESEMAFLEESLDLNKPLPAFDRRDLLAFSTKKNQGREELERKIQKSLARFRASHKKA